jgi:hypothetical protein
MCSIKILLRSLLNIIYVISIFIFSFSLISCGDEKKPPADKETFKIDPSKLVGRWLRPDGGYVIEIVEVHEQGTLNAKYFNPQPINIAEAEWKIEEERLRVFIKFDDVNYPGSTYTLDYFPDRDQMIGAYVQAVQKQSYYVEFIRNPN